MGQGGITDDFSFTFFFFWTLVQYQFQPLLWVICLSTAAGIESLITTKKKKKVIISIALTILIDNVTSMEGLTLLALSFLKNNKKIRFFFLWLQKREKNSRYNSRGQSGWFTTVMNTGQDIFVFPWDGEGIVHFPITTFLVLKEERRAIKCC